MSCSPLVGQFCPSVHQVAQLYICEPLPGNMIRASKTPVPSWKPTLLGLPFLSLGLVLIDAPVVWLDLVKTRLPPETATLAALVVTPCCDPPLNHDADHLVRSSAVPLNSSLNFNVQAPATPVGIGVAGGGVVVVVGGGVVVVG